MVCEECWAVASARAFYTGGCTADYYFVVLKEREGVCQELRLVRGLVVVDESGPVSDKVWSLLLPDLHDPLRPTDSFPDGAPQRESYDSDDGYAEDCLQYENEKWQQKLDREDAEHPEPGE